MRGASQGARRYARALLDVALEKGAAARVREGLREAVALLSGNRGLMGLLAHPALAAERKKAILAAVWGQAGGDEIVQRLLGLLLERNRILLLPAVEASFGSLWNAQRKVVAAEVVSAVPLDDDHIQALARAIAEATGMEPELKTAVDPAVMGGLLLRMGGRVYDGTVRSRLGALKERLVGRAAHS